MIKAKEGVTFFGVRPEMVMAARIIESAYAHFGYDTVVTSCTDGQHSYGSLHYQGAAMDFRTRHVDSRSELEEITTKVRQALGSEFDVVLEDTHLHVEFQPKRGDG